MSIQRLLGMIALVLFIAFVAVFFTVLVRLSRVGVTTERYAEISASDFNTVPAVSTRFDLIGQDPSTGQLIFNAYAMIDTGIYPFTGIQDGQTLVMRVENLIPEIRKHSDLTAVFHNYTGDQFVLIEFGQFKLDIIDRRDFYPFDGYNMSFNYAYYIPDNPDLEHGVWYEPKQAEFWSMTNLNLLNPRYGNTASDVMGFKFRVSRLRILQFLTVSLVLIQILFMLYLLTIVNLQDLLAKGLGYLIGLFIIRMILATDAPLFPSFIDYSTMFLICVTFFLMLYKFLGGEETHALITIPPAWRDALLGRPETPVKDNDDHEAGEEDSDQD